MSDADKPVFDLTAGGVRYCQEPELRARISTLEARVAELTRQYEVDLSRASEITRGALDDRDRARARVEQLARARAADLGAHAAELTREHGEAIVTVATTASAGVAALTSDLASTQDEVKRLRGFLDEMADKLAAARAERDEAVADARVLAHAYEHDTRPPQGVVKRSLARLAAAPEKETTP